MFKISSWFVKLIEYFYVSLCRWAQEENTFAALKVFMFSTRRILMATGFHNDSGGLSGSQ